MTRHLTKSEAAHYKSVLRFVFVADVLGWGLSAAIVWSFIMWLFAPLSGLQHLFLGSIILFPVGGLGWRLAVWFLTEYQNSRHTATSAPYRYGLR